MERFTKRLLVAAAAVAAIVGILYGMQQTSIDLLEAYERGYTLIYRDSTSLVTPENATRWSAVTRTSLQEVDSRTGMRKRTLWFALPGSRGEMRKIDEAFERMVEIRRRQLADVEQRLAQGEELGPEEKWIELLPSPMHDDLRKASRMIAWFKADAERYAELRSLAEGFETRTARLRPRIEHFWNPFASA